MIPVSGQPGPASNARTASARPASQPAGRTQRSLPEPAPRRSSLHTVREGIGRTRQQRRTGVRPWQSKDPPREDRRALANRCGAEGTGASIRAPKPPSGGRRRQAAPTHAEAYPDRLAHADPWTRTTTFNSRASPTCAAPTSGPTARPSRPGRHRRPRGLPVEHAARVFERLTAWLPALIEHRCSDGERGGFLQRLREGTWPAISWSTWSSNCRTWPACPPASARRAAPPSAASTAWWSGARRGGHPHRLAQGHRLLMAPSTTSPSTCRGSGGAARDLDDCYLGPSTACIVDAATDRRIPYIRLNDGNLVQLGHGAGSAASGPPRPTSPAPSPRASPATRI